MRKLLGFGKQATRDQGSSSGSGRHTRKESKEKVKAGSTIVQDLRSGAIKRDMREERFASGFPEDHPSLADKVESHRRGEIFKYAVITNAPSDERKNLFSRLKNYKPAAKVKTLTLNDIPAIRLVGNEVNFSLSDAVDAGFFKDAPDYVLVDCVFVHFVPLDSFANEKSTVTVQINDFRKISGTVARRQYIDNTMGYNMLFSLDYCVETRDINNLTLSFTCPMGDFQEGVAWAAVKVIMQVQFLSFPKRMPLTETLGCILFSDTDLDQFNCDPREFDMVITPNVLNELRKSNQRGEVENLTIAKQDKKETVTARTILGEALDDGEVESAIEKMKFLAVQRERQAAAQVENRRKLEEVMEKGDSIGQSTGAVGNYNTSGTPEVSPDDSMSMAGSLPEQQDQVHQYKGKGKTVGFEG